MSSAFVNAHITRVLKAGADPTTIDRTWLDTVDAWLTPADDLLFWPSAGFGVAKSGSAISKVFCLGTTRLPRGGDYTPETPANTTYSATAINGTTPGWVNSATSARGYFGSARGLARYNNIRRLHHHGLTCVAAYQKNHTNPTVFLQLGQGGGFYLQNTSGSPGSAKFQVARWGGAWTVDDTHGTTLANNAAHIIGGTYDGTSLAVTAYVEGVASGSPATATDNYILLGGVGSSTHQFFLASGCSYSQMEPSAFSTAINRAFGDNQCEYSCSDLIVFGTALSAARMASLNALLRARIGA